MLPNLGRLALDVPHIGPKPAGTARIPPGTTTASGRDEEEPYEVVEQEPTMPCPICYEDIYLFQPDTYVLACAAEHACHTVCLRQQNATGTGPMRNRCPECRQPQTPETLARLRAPDVVAAAEAAAAAATTVARAEAERAAAERAEVQRRRWEAAGPAEAATATADERARVVAVQRAARAEERTIWEAAEERAGEAERRAEETRAVAEGARTRARTMQKRAEDAEREAALSWLGWNGAAAAAVQAAAAAATATRTALAAEWEAMRLLAVAEVATSDAEVQVEGAAGEMPHLAAEVADWAEAVVRVRYLEAREAAERASAAVWAAAQAGVWARIVESRVEGRATAVAAAAAAQAFEWAGAQAGE